MLIIFRGPCYHEAIARMPTLADRRERYAELYSRARSNPTTNHLGSLCLHGAHYNVSTCFCLCLYCTLVKTSLA